VTDFAESFIEIRINGTDFPRKRMRYGTWFKWVAKFVTVKYIYFSLRPVIDYHKTSFLNIGKTGI
jgi:hypothetical protein